MSLITPDFGLLFWMTVIFVLVFGILAKFGFPVITGMVSKRQDRINDSIRLAKEAEQRIGELSRQQQEMLDEARSEQALMLKEAAAQRDAIVAQAREQARQEADKILQSTREQIAAAKEAALRDIRSQVAEISVGVAEKIVRGSLGSADAQSVLIESLLDEAMRSSDIS